MNKSQQYPTLTRYCYGWDWLVQFRVYKPKKQKKEWVDWTEVIGGTAEEAKKAIGFLCERKGWTLREIYLMKPTAIAYAFDRDAPGTTFLSKEQKQQLIPRPEVWGTEYRPLTPAQVQQQRQQAKQAQQQAKEQARQQAQQAKQQAKQAQRQRQHITAHYPLFAPMLLATELPQAA